MPKMNQKGMIMPNGSSSGGVGSLPKCMQTPMTKAPMKQPGSK